MTTTRRASMFAGWIALCCAPLLAQTPKDPPPWWTVNDEDTVSLFWDFNSVVNPLAPTVQVLPSWYVMPPNFGFVNSSNITRLGTVGVTHTGVLGFTGNGTQQSGTIDLTIDNDPRVDWIKIFYIQFDSFAGTGDKILAAVEEDLGKYERGIIEEKTESLGNGWERTTLGMYLIPQPMDEKIAFDLTSSTLNDIGIDNLFVNSKCVKPPPDKIGTPLGDVDPAYSVNLSQASGNQNVQAVAVTEDSADVPTIWVGGRSTAGTDQIVRLDAAGSTVGAPIPLPALATSVNGVTDFAVVKRPLVGGGRRTFVAGVSDLGPGNTIEITSIDADATPPAVVPALQVSVPRGALGPGPFSLAFMEHGDLGNGSFFIVDQNGDMIEVARQTGAILRTLPASTTQVPAGIRGAAYDPLRAKFYWFVAAPSPLPNGTITQVLGVEHDAYSFQPTGTTFLGDLTVPAAPTPGGIAGGIEVLRRRNGDFRLVCVQRVGVQSVLRGLRGPFTFGWSKLGRMGMQNGPPIRGNLNWTVTLSGLNPAPRTPSDQAILFIGFDNRNLATIPPTPLPVPLAFLGLPENYLSITPDLNSGIVPAGGGGASIVIPIPANLPAGIRVFFQWLVTDPSNGQVAASQAGETLLY